MGTRSARTAGQASPNVLPLAASAFRFGLWGVLLPLNFFVPSPHSKMFFLLGERDYSSVLNNSGTVTVVHGNTAALERAVW